MRAPRLLLVVLAGAIVLTAGVLALRSGHSSRAEVLGEVIERPTTSTTAPAEPTTTATTAAAPEATQPSAPETTPVPPTARLEVRFSDPEGTITVSADGPDGSSSADATGGSAAFDGLTPGSYELTITTESDPAPTSADGTNIGTALSTRRDGPYELEAGSTAVVTCSSTACERTA